LKIKVTENLNKIETKLPKLCLTAEQVTKNMYNMDKIFMRVSLKLEQVMAEKPLIEPE
jgi:hypothetical protein